MSCKNIRRVNIVLQISPQLKLGSSWKFIWWSIIWKTHWKLKVFGKSKLIHNYPPWKTFEVQNCKNMENTLKIKVFGKSILFHKYLRNKSSDLHTIFYSGQLLSCELKFQISWRSVHQYACTSSKRAHALYNSFALIYEQSFMKFKT